MVKVDNGVAGKNPTVTFTSKDYAGNPVPMSAADHQPEPHRPGAGRSDHGLRLHQLRLRCDHPGLRLRESGADRQVRQRRHLHLHLHPRDSGEGDRARTRSASKAGAASRCCRARTQQMTSQYGAINKMINFSVDGSQSGAAPAGGGYRQVQRLPLRAFAARRESQPDRAVRAVPQPERERRLGARHRRRRPADKTLPHQSVNFALMIHKIHTGEKLATDFNQTYIIVGFGGSHNDFSEVRYPGDDPTPAAVGDTAKCYMCHVNNSEAVFPIGKNNVLDTQGRISPAPATTSACTACHLKLSALSHAVSQTDPKFGESCDVCHAQGTDFDVLKEHAGK